LPKNTAISSTFSVSGARSGARAALVLTPTIVVFGATFGMLAATSGLTVWEAAIMSAVVCAGTAQFAALQIWTDPVSWFGVGMASLAMNSRYLLLGATVRSWFEGLSATKAYASLFFMYDGNWATATRDRAGGNLDAAHMIGGGVVMCSIWTVATAAGHTFGGLIGDPRRAGLDFVITAFFASMAIMFWRGRGDVAPICAAMVAAVAVDRLFPGPWYIVAGALAGSVVAALQYQPAAKAAADAS
jgi:predicted branched-subunit amino acid permease